jgi:hypothetical protein
MFWFTIADFPSRNSKFTRSKRHSSPLPSFFHAHHRYDCLKQKKHKKKLSVDLSSRNSKFTRSIKGTVQCCLHFFTLIITVMIVSNKTNIKRNFWSICLLSSRNSKFTRSKRHSSCCLRFFGSFHHPRILSKKT